MSVNYLDNVLVNGTLSAANFYGNGANLTNLTISIPTSSNWNNSYNWVSSNSANASFTSSVSAPTISANNLFVNSINSQGVITIPTTNIIQTVSSNGNTTPLLISASSNQSVYNQIQNLFLGASASTDLVLTNDQGIAYLDIGINSTQYNGNLYSPSFNITNPNDSYVYATGGNLAIGTSTNNNLVFFTGGTLSANAAMIVTAAGAVSASNFIGNGANLTGINASNGVCQQGPNGEFIGGGCYNVSYFQGATVGGGASNQASSYNATVAGGSANKACGGYGGFAPTVGGGYANTASGQYPTVSGGKSNNATAYAATVAGGCGNTASANYSNINGGCANTVIFNNSNINGGIANTMSCYVNSGGGTATASTNTINGGSTNFIGLSTCGNGASYLFNNAIGGGVSNCITSVSNGSQHIATTCNSFIGGGTGNCLAGISSSVVGGSTNTLSANCAFIAGGRNNVSCGFDNTFILGSNLTASQPNYTYVNNLSSQGKICGTYYGNGSNLTNVTSINGVCQSGNNFIGGGSGNTASAAYSITIGGKSNTNQGVQSLIASGSANNISNASGPVYLSDIIGGQYNTISGYSLVYQSTILNGCCNIIYPFITGGGGGKIYNSTILNGSCNSFGTCNNPSVLCSSFIGVGDCNCIIGYGSSCYNFIGSGVRNSIGTNSNYCTTQSSFIISGSGNCIYNSGFNGILGGCGNILNACNSFIIGSNINGSQQGYTYVNNLSSQGNIYASGNIFGGSYLNVLGGTTYSLQLSDNGTTIGSTNTNGLTATAITNTITYPVGYSVNFIQLAGNTSTGRIAVSAQSQSLVYNSNNYYKTRTLYSTSTLIYTGTTGWVVFGDLNT